MHFSLFRLFFRIIFPAAIIILFNLVSLPADSSYVDDGHHDYGLSPPTGPGLISEYNIEIPMRDGKILKGDIFRPNGPGTYPVIMAEAPFPHHIKAFLGVDDNGGVGTLRAGLSGVLDSSRLYLYLVQHPRVRRLGRADRGIGFPDYYDAIEWAAVQPWSNGNIGLYGISYYAFSQYFATGWHPPHLKAIVPWEGLSDPYRDIGYRGGIPCMFGQTFAAMMQFGATDPSTATDHIKMMRENPLINEVWSYGANVHFCLLRPRRLG